MIIKRWAGHVARTGEESGVYRVLVGKTEGRRPMGRPRRRWVDNITIILVSSTNNKYSFTIYGFGQIINIACIRKSSGPKTIP